MSIPNHAPPREHPYSSFLHRVAKPSRYVGGEHGEAKKEWDRVRGRFCLAFPDTYEVGMSHLGFKILYGILNGTNDLLAERAYAPWTDMEREIRAHGERLRSLESWHALADFDVVGFSLQFELTFTNVLAMMDLGGIPIRARARGERDPLILAGGPTATHAEPMAPFVDAFVIGDGEECVTSITRTWIDLREQGVPREARLRALASITGVYVPSLYTTTRDEAMGWDVVTATTDGEAPFPIRRAHVPDLGKFPFPVDGPVAATETVFDRVAVELARGCTEGCRFCQAGMIYRPVRERDPSSVVDAIDDAITRGGYDEASMTCLSTADYSAINPLIKEVTARTRDRNVSLGISSLRAYGLDEDVLDELKTARAGGLTFAPEAGTQRMRDVVNKNVTEAQLMQTAERVFSRGWSKMKLYFMIGLPTEEDVDVRGIVETGARALTVAKQVRKARGGKDRSPAKVTVSVSTHVPKPHTPFQWCAMDAPDEIVRKQTLLRDASRGTGIDLRMHDSTGSWLEGVLARGDRRIGDVVEHAFANGARFDSWEEQLKLDVWRAAFAACDIDPAAFLGTIPLSARLPWDHIDVGLEEGFLAREYRASLQNRLSPPCGKVAGMFVHHTTSTSAEADSRRLVCYDCGVACDMTKMRQERVEFLVKLETRRRAAPPSPPPDIADTADLQPAQPDAALPTSKRPTIDHNRTTTRIRLRFTKLGRAAYTSHLDLIRLLPRILRRAGLALSYTQGFHPRPDLTYGPALSLGIASLAEYVDVRLAGDVEVDPDTLLAALRTATVEGVSFTGVRVLGPNDAALGRTIDEAEYVVGLARAALPMLGIADDDSAPIALTALFAERRAAPMIVERVIEGVRKTVDIGAYLIDARARDGSEALTAAGVIGSLVPVRVRLRVTGSGTAKISETLAALTGRDDLPARFVRASLASEACGDPLDWRAPAPRARAAADTKPHEAAE